MSSEQNEDVTEKLKALEKNLAKELDEKVRLVEPTDVRLEGKVSVNPSFQTEPTKKETKSETGPINVSSIPVTPTTSTISAPATGPSAPLATGAAAAPQKAPEEISLDDLDGLLNEIDEGFGSKMNEITEDLKDVRPEASALESVPIGADFLEEDGGEHPSVEAEIDEEEELFKEILPPAASGKSEVLKTLLALLKATGQMPVVLGRALIERAKAIRGGNPKDVIFDYLSDVRAEVENWIAHPRALLGEFKKMGLNLWAMPTASKIRLGVAIVSVFLAVIVATNFLRDLRHGDEDKDPFLRSFGQVATSVELIRDLEDTEDVESPLRHPEFLVLLPRMVANLKHEQGARGSVIIVEVYVEASNQDTAVELRDREVELRDMMLRVFETMTLDEIDNIDGKRRAKVLIRSYLNKILNRGRAQRIFFKNITFK